MSRVVLGLLWLSLLGSGVAALPLRHWVTELADNFALYFALVHGLGVLFLIVFRHSLARWCWWATMVALLWGSYGTGRDLLPFLLAPRELGVTCADPTVLNVGFANISSENPDPIRAVDTLLGRNDDLLVMLESRDELVERGRERFPHRTFVHQIDAFGIGVLSSFAQGEGLQTFLGDELRPVAILHPRLQNGADVVLAVFDALPSFDDDALYKNWLLVRRMGIFLRHEAPNALVLTDLNATPFSGFYKSLVREAKLSDVRWGRGLARTWDMQRPLIRFAIDHGFVKGALEAEEVELFDVPGSDHRGLSMRLRICQG